MAEEKDNKEGKENLEEIILVDLPLTDTEIFGRILFGIKPERPVKITKGDYKFLKQAHGTALAGILIVGAIAGYVDIKEKYGSLGKAYQVFMEHAEQLPWKAVFSP